MTRGRDGLPVLRLLDCGPSFFAPCRNDTGCPKGTSEKPRTLRPINQRAYEHYRECRAVGRFPDDPIVKRNAVIIRDVIDDIESEREQKFRKSVLRLAVKNG